MKWLLFLALVLMIMVVASDPVPTCSCPTFAQVNEILAVEKAGGSETASWVRTCLTEDMMDSIEALWTEGGE